MFTKIIRKYFTIIHLCTRVQHDNILNRSGFNPTKTKISRWAGGEVKKGATHVGIFHDIRKTVSTKTKVAFTLGEVLITLAIIGVIAAVTIPMLVKNYQKKITVSRLKKAYTTVNNILLQSYSDNGSVTDEIYHLGDEYVQNYWLRYMRNPIYYKDSSPYKKETGQYFSHWDNINGKNMKLYVAPPYHEKNGWGFYMFSSVDGVVYYLTSHWKQNNQYEVYIDINGINEPNILGKDIFLFYQDFENHKLTTQSPSQTNFSNEYFIDMCRENGRYCAMKIIRDGWEIKDDYPW